MNVSLLNLLLTLNRFLHSTQQTFTPSKLTRKTLEKGVKYVQSSQKIHKVRRRLYC